MPDCQTLWELPSLELPPYQRAQEMARSMLAAHELLVAMSGRLQEELARLDVYLETQPLEPASGPAQVVQELMLEGIDGYRGALESLASYYDSLEGDALDSGLELGLASQRSMEAAERNLADLRRCYPLEA